MSINELMGRIDAVTQESLTHFGTLSHGELNWKPDAKSWSIAQCLDHLIRVNESYYPVIDSIRQGTYVVPRVAKVNFLVEFFGRFIMKGVAPGNRRKVRTFPIWEPAQDGLPEDIVRKFAAHQQELKNFIASNLDLIDGGAVISSPANKYFVYRIDKAVDIIVTHEERHLNQAKAVLAAQPNSAIAAK